MIKAAPGRIVLACLVAHLGSFGSAHADDEPGVPPDARSLLGSQLSDEAAAIDTTLAMVGEKLAAADIVRSKRLGAAYRLLRAPVHAGATAADRMGLARRRAGARLLVDRDAAERGMLANEASYLRDARARTSAATARIATITLPQDLARPAAGKVVRKFGTIEHERAKATLARRGIDLEVDPRAKVGSPADGTVRYAGPIRGLDEAVIIDHGDYFTVIGKLGGLTVPVGAPLHKGDPVGRAARHRVYLEVRVRVGPGGLPVDPEPLFETSPGE